MLWVALYGAGEVRRIDPTTGAVCAIIKLPAAAGVETTAVAFGGPDLDELYITTASKSFTAEQRAAMPLAGRLFKVRRGALAQIAKGTRGVSQGGFRL